MKKVGKVLFCFTPLLVALAIEFIVTFVGVMIYGGVLAFQMAMKGETDPEVIENSIINAVSGDAVVIISALLAAVYAIVFGIWYKKGFKDKVHLPLKDIFSVKRVLLIAFMGMSIQFGMNMILTTMETWKPSWFESYNKLMESMGIGQTWVAFLLTVILAPIGEELIFRGVVLQYAKKSMPFYVANILQAIMFGFLHLNVIQGIYAFIFGLFMGLVCQRFQSVYASMLLHFVINLTGYCVGVWGSDSMFSDVRVVVAILIASVGVLAVTTITVYKEKVVETKQPLILEET